TAAGKESLARHYPLAELADAFIGSVIAPDATLEDIEATLAALVKLREAHPDLDSSTVGSFFKFAKQLVRELRAAGRPTMSGPELHSFRMMTAYFGMLGLDR
ncbi:MAG TPA: hypothetical protein VML75_12165, partial [Kofleriaceae bacterium]|nr:hypothetical protein [Kofleriaceae bacterium]